MTLERYLWRVRRTDNGLYETVISDIEPTTAPSDGGSIDTAHTTILESKFQSIISEGYINLESSLADNQAIIINASNSNGGIDINCGLGGIAIDSGNVISLDAQALINITTTSGNIELDTPALIDLNGQSGINIGNDADVAPVNIATGLASKTVTIGNSTGNTTINLISGIGGIVLTSQDTTDDSIRINTLGGIDSDSTGPINFATGSSIGGAITLDAAFNNGGITLSAGSQGIAINSGTGLIGIGHWSAGDIQIGTSATARNITIGNSTGSTGLTLTTGTNGLFLNTPNISQYQPAHTALSNTNQTLTITQLKTSILTITPTTNRILTLPTAANIVGGFSNPMIGQSFDFSIINSGATNSGNITISMGTGGSSIGRMVIEPYSNQTGTYFYSGSGNFRLRLTNVTASSEAYTIYRIG